MKLVTRGTKHWGNSTVEGGLNYWILYGDVPNDVEVIDLLPLLEYCQPAYIYGGPGQYFQDNPYMFHKGKWLIIKQRFGYDI